MTTLAEKKKQKVIEVELPTQEEIVAVLKYFQPLSNTAENEITSSAQKKFVKPTKEEFYQFIQNATSYKPLLEKHQNLISDNQQLKNDNQQLIDDNQQLKNDNQQLIDDNQQLKNDYHQLKNDNQQLIDDYQQLKDDYQQLKDDYRKLKDDNQQLINDNQQLKNDNQQLIDDYQKLQNDYQSLKENNKRNAGRKHATTAETRKDIIAMYYNEKMTMQQIAKHINVSFGVVQGIIKKHKEQTT